MYAMSLSKLIQPGETSRITCAPQVPFRVQRIIISPASFRVSAARRVWTWPIMKIGGIVTRVHRQLAKLLGVDLNDPHERRVYIEEVGDEDEEPDDPRARWDATERAWYVLAAVPLNRRERALRPIGKLAQAMANARRRWQEKQLAHVAICGIYIGKRAQFARDAEVPADIFAANAVDGFVTLDPCMTGLDIEIDFRNNSKHSCDLVVALLGTAVR